jgi:RHS repeat-associated protein
LSRRVVGAGTSTFVYTSRGLTNVTDELGFVSKYARDEFGRLTYFTNANSEVTGYTYNAAGSIRTLTDAKASVTSWGYDTEGRDITKTNASNVEIFRYTYDADGKVTNRWTPEKLNAGYGYDDEGNLTSINYNTSADITYTYDALSRLSTVADASGTTSFGYSANHLAYEDGPWDSDRLTYTYTGGRRSKMSLAQPAASSWEVSYGYDTARRLDAITSSDGTFDYQYSGGVGSPTSPSLLVKKLVLPNTSYVTNEFDSLGRILATRLKTSGGAELNAHSYSYNNGHQRTAQTRVDGSSLAYGYDNIGQLISALGTHGATNRWQERFGYIYDKAGNLSNRVANGFTNTWTVDVLNQLATYARSTTNYTVAGFTTTPATSLLVNGTAALRFADNMFVRTNVTLTNGANTFTALAQDSVGRLDTNIVSVNIPTTSIYSYDQNGNLKSDGLRTFSYDDDNQLISVFQTNNWLSEFVYDGLHRRRIKKDYSSVSGSWVQTYQTAYIYDEMLTVQERDIRNVPTATYTRGLDLGGGFGRSGGIGGMLARKDHTGDYNSMTFYHSDANGNISIIIDERQAVVARYIYDPYGNTIAKSGKVSDVNKYRFSSKEVDVQSGQYYFGRRFYDPLIQRWISRDPIEEDGGINLHRFVESDPLNRLDPNGECILPALATTAGVVVIFAGAYFWGQYMLHHQPQPNFRNRPPKNPNTTPAYPVPPIPANPADPPAPGWDWKGQQPPGSKGNWVGPNGDKLNPDLGHGPGVPPHWDWTDPDGNPWRVFPDGKVEPK